MLRYFSGMFCCTRYFGGGGGWWWWWWWVLHMYVVTCGNQLCFSGGFGSNYCISPGLDINNKFYYPEWHLDVKKIELLRTKEQLFMFYYTEFHQFYSKGFWKSFFKRALILVVQHDNLDHLFTLVEHVGFLFFCT